MLDTFKYRARHWSVSFVVVALFGLIDIASLCFAPATASLMQLGSTVLVAGDSGISTDLYDPDANSFAPANPSMNDSRIGAAIATLSSGKILIVGGVSSTFLASTDLYDPLTQTFAPPTDIASMNEARENATATLLPNGKVLIAGGLAEAGPLSSTELYDPLTNSFVPPSDAPSMNVARYSATATLLPNGKVLIAGGISFYGDPVASTELYDPATNSFAPAAHTASMNVERGFTTATLLPTGQVLIAGGMSPEGQQLTSTDLYSPANNTFAPPTKTASMNTARDLATATLLPNGKVLIAGGRRDPSGSSLASTELYDPRTNTFAVSDSTASMNTGRFSAAAVMLPNGKVLIAGGLTLAAAPLASTELYDSSFNSFSTAPNTAVMKEPRNSPIAALVLPPYSFRATTFGKNAPQPLSGPVSSAANPGAATLTPTPTPSPMITFVADGSLADSGQRVTSLTVSLPTGTQSGDLLLAQIAVYDGAAANVPTPPSGWSVIRHDAIGNANKITSWLYYKIAGDSEPASYTWSISPQYAAGVMGAWRGVATIIPIDQSSGATAAGTSPVSDAAPPLTPTTNSELQVYFYGSQGSSAPAITEPAAVTQRSNTMSSKEGFTLAFGDLAAPPGGIASPIYVANANLSGSMPVMTAQAVLLLPEIGPTATATATITPTPTRTPVPSQGTITPTLTSTPPQTPTPVPTFSGVTQTPTLTSTMTFTPFITQTSTYTPTQTPTSPPTPIPTIEFIASGPLSDSSQPLTSLAVKVPLGTELGDLLLAQIVIYDGGATNVPTAPSGWSAIRRDAINNGNKITSWLYFKVAGNDEPASYVWNMNLQYAAGVIGTWRGASATSPIDQSSGAAAGGTSPVFEAAPSLTPVSNYELQVYFYGSQSTFAPTITEPGEIAQRSNITSAEEGFALAFGDLFAPPEGIASPLYAATTTLSGTMPVMTAQAVLLLPQVGPPPFRTPTPTMTMTPTYTPTFTPISPTHTVTPTATPTIAFVAASPLTDSSQPLTSVTVSVPGGVHSDDILLAQIVVYDGSATNVPMAPSGWNVIRHDSISNGNKITSWLYFKVAGNNEPASYGWNINTQYAAGVMGAWRGISTFSPIDQSSGATAAGASPFSVAAPSLTPRSANELQVYFYASQTNLAPTIIAPGTIDQRSNNMSTKEGFTLAFGDLAAPPGGTASPTYAAEANSSGSTPVMTAQAILLTLGP
jgi:Galactose oxidase, central domain